LGRTIWSSIGSKCRHLKHLARTKSLYGKDETEASLCDSLWEYMLDVRNSSLPIFSTDISKRDEMKKNFVEVDTPKVLVRLEKILQKNGSGYFVGSGITFIDLMWWYWLENLSDQGLLDVSGYQHLNKFKSSIESRPNIAAYRKNPKRHPVQYLFSRYVMHCYPESTNAGKAVIAGNFGGIKIEYPQNFKFGVDNKTVEFLRKNPNGEVPVLDAPEGPIYESNAIAKYITRKGNDKGLYGANEYEASLIDQWIEWYRSKVEKSHADWIYPILGYMTYKEETYKASRENITKQFGLLNRHLDGREWIVGKRVTLADVVIFSALVEGFRIAYDPTFLQSFPSFTAWAKRCIAQPQFSSYFVNFEFATREKKPGEIKLD